MTDPDPLVEALARRLLATQQGTPTGCAEPHPWMWTAAQDLDDILCYALDVLVGDPNGCDCYIGDIFDRFTERLTHAQHQP